MSVLFLVVPLALLLVGGAVAAFLWATYRGQFDDLTTPALRALHDDSEISAREPRNSPPAAPRSPTDPSASEVLPPKPPVAEP
jgi:cbb3-type cytochrome oxidase maturation protein